VEVERGGESGLDSDFTGGGQGITIQISVVNNGHQFRIVGGDGGRRGKRKRDRKGDRQKDDGHFRMTSFFHGRFPSLWFSTVNIHLFVENSFFGVLFLSGRFGSDGDTEI
jgi:hypothetical protein